MIDTKVTYTLELDGSFYIIEDVPARVCQETGEEFFSPDTVERIQAMIKGGAEPIRVVETPVYEHTADWARGLAVLAGGTLLCLRSE